MKINNELILGLGSNIEPRLHYLNEAIELLQNEFGTPSSISSIYESLPVDFLNQPKFLNLVIMFNPKKNQTPFDILEKIQLIEQKIGRVKTIPKGPRTIDIDILYYNDWNIKYSNLCLPHQEIENRDFVIYPLQEIRQCAKIVKIPLPNQVTANNLSLFKNCPNIV